MIKLLQIKNCNSSKGYNKFELTLKHRVRLRALFFSLWVVFVGHNGVAQCMWEHYSEIDCAYNIEIGFDCADYLNLVSTHSHNFWWGGGTSVLCVGGPAPPSWTGHSGCGCWGIPGGTYGQAGCAFCGFPDSALCDSAHPNSNYREFKYLIVSSALFPTIKSKVHEWNEYYNYWFILGSYPNRTICCDINADPDQCMTCACACGTVEVDWENQKTYLKPAHYPYYPLCPDPNP